MYIPSYRETTFGELKAGDTFIHNGIEYEKISGGLADMLSIPSEEPVEFQPETSVKLVEL